MKTNETTKQKGRLFTTKQMVLISLLSALSYGLMLLHLPYKHLGFLEFEFSDIPAVIAALQFGPLAGVIIELIKNLVKALTASTTATVGELANFLISCAYIIPVGLLYKLRTTKNTARSKAKIVKGISTINSNKTKLLNNLYLVFIFSIGTIVMVIIAALLNYFVMLPLYAKLFGGMDSVIGFASQGIPAIKDISSLIIIGITPYNIVKGIGMSVIGYYTYRLLKGRLE